MKYLKQNRSKYQIYILNGQWISGYTESGLDIKGHIFKEEK